MNPSSHGGHLNVLGSISARCEEAIVNRCNKQSFERGEVLWTQGDAAGFVAFIRQGKAMSTYYSPEGKTGVTGFWSDGDILGAVDLSGLENRQMTVRFLDISTVYILSLSHFYHLLETFPELAQQVVRALSVRLRWVAQLALSLATHSTEDRVRGMLLALSASFGVKCDQGVLIDLKLSHEDLASMVGVSRQFVNGALNNIKSAGYIKIGNRKIIITDLHGLQAVRYPS